MKMKHILTFLGLTLLLSACANIGQLSGGERDTAPPTVDSTQSTRFLQTNFVAQPIELTFNEWIKLEKPESQIVISPPLDYPITTKLHGHTLALTFDKKEVLRPDATYTINFGTAVKDLTESNPAADLRFVFSTGASIDSFAVIANIAEAQSNAPAADVLLMLYDNVADTVVRKTKPLYFGKSDKSGVVNVRNIRAGTYRVFALLDGNSDYLYNADNEMIGFPNGLITVTDSTSPIRLKVAVAEGFVPLKALESNIKTYGVFRILYNRPPTDANVVVTGNNAPYWHDTKGDTLRLWYANTDSFSLYINSPNKADTFRIKPPDATAWRTAAKLTQADLLPVLPNRTGRPNLPAIAQTQHPLEPLFVPMSNPLQSIDTNQLQLLEEVARDPKDTTRTSVEPTFARVHASYSIDSTNKFRCMIRYPWVEDKTYKFVGLPNAVSDIYGISNADTLTLVCRVLARKSLGDVQLKASNLDSTHNYIAELMLSENTVRTHAILAGSSTHNFTFEAVAVGAYSIRIVEDLNQNLRWDGPNYDLQRQPEKLLFKKVEPLRANWTQEAVIDWKLGGDSSGSKKGKKL